MKLCIGELAEVLGGQLVLGSLPPLAGPFEPVRRIVVDSREARAGDVYWALSAPGFDGAHLAEDALLRGAFGVVVSGRHVEPWAGRFSILVADANQALMDLANCLPSRKQTGGRRKRRPLTSTELVQRLLAGEPVTLEHILERLCANVGQYVSGRV